MLSSRLHRGHWPSLVFACAAQALSLDAFRGQTEAKLLIERLVGKSESQQRTMLMQADENEETDYTCSKSKPCELGCCGSL